MFSSCCSFHQHNFDSFFFQPLRCFPCALIVLYLILVKYIMALKYISSAFIHNGFPLMVLCSSFFFQSSFSFLHFLSLYLYLSSSFLSLSTVHNLMPAITLFSIRCFAINSIMMYGYTQYTFKVNPRTVRCIEASLKIRSTVTPYRREWTKQQQSTESRDTKKINMKIASQNGWRNTHKRSATDGNVNGEGRK